MIPVLDKDSIRVITLHISPEQVEYVAGVNSINNDAREYIETASQYIDEIVYDDFTNDILYIIKLMAFSAKFQTLHWASISMDYHKTIEKFKESLDEYTDEVAENLQAIYGLFDPSKFQKLELPIDNNPLTIINELKICVNNWFKKLSENTNVEYEGCKNATSGFIQIIHKYIYLFRLCKINNYE